MYTTIHSLHLLITLNQNVNCSLQSMTSSPKQHNNDEELSPVIKHLQQKNKQRKLKEQDDQYKYDTNSK